MTTQEQAEQLAYKAATTLRDTPARDRWAPVILRETNLATIIAEREAWNNSFNQANSERLKLQNQVERLTEEKEAWKRDAEALYRLVGGKFSSQGDVDMTLFNHRALVEKYK